MRYSSLVAALLIAVMLVAGALHAAYACSVGSSHVAHSRHSHHDSDRRPGCCQEGATAPLVSRMAGGAERASSMLAVAAQPMVNVGIRATAETLRRAPALPVDHFRSSRLHLSLAILIV